MIECKRFCNSCSGKELSDLSNGLVAKFYFDDESDNLRMHSDSFYGIFIQLDYVAAETFF